MKKLVLFSLLMFFLLIQPAFAVKISNMGIYASINDDNSVSHNIKITFINRPETFEYSILSNIENVSVYADDKKIACDVTSGTVSRIVCDLKDVMPEKMEINYVATDLVKDSDGRFIFSSDYRVPLMTNNFYVEAKLPEGFVLVKEDDILSQCFPADCLHATDGRKVIVIWNIQDVMTGEGLYVSATYENIGGATKTEIPFIFLAIPFAAIIVLILVTWLIYKKKLGMDMVLPVLKKDEKTIMEKLIETKGGYVNQKVLVKESGYSKAKVSKILKSLEERGIVKLERIGRKNKVFLQRKFENKGQKGSGNN